MRAHRSALRIVRDQAPLLAVLAAVATVTGLVLRFREAQLFDEPWLLGLVPVINAVGGNLGAVLGARITSALHLGTLQPRLAQGELTENLTLALLAGAGVYSLLALAVWLVTPQLGLMPALSLWTVLALVFGSGIALSLVVISLSVAAAFVAFRRGLDPDDVVIPLVTNAADLLGVIILFSIAGGVL